MLGSAVDIRDVIFSQVKDRKINARISVEREGIIAGTDEAKAKLHEIGVSILYLAAEGSFVKAVDTVARFSGNPKQITAAEDAVIGCLAKASGIATAAYRAVELAAGKMKIVSGAWKKMPPEIKRYVRNAVKVGGAAIRISDEPFVYFDKNYVRIFGGIKETLRSAEKFPERLKVIQVRGEFSNISEEVKEAVAGGADIIMVDTGDYRDAVEAVGTLEEIAGRHKAKIAFAGGIKIRDIPQLVELGVDMIDIGTEIIDAPLLDMRLDVTSVSGADKVGT